MTKHKIEDDLATNMGLILVKEIEAYLAKVAQFQVLYPEA